MAKSIIVLAFIATAYSAVIKNEDVHLQRIARSPCSTCGPSPPPNIHIPPPPPPPLLRTQNWSGLARSSDGLQNTVFSGAAAAADQGPLAGGEAFSLASSSAGAGFDGSANSGSASGAGSSNGAGLKAHYGGTSGVKGSFAAHGEEQKVFGGGFKESHDSYHSGGSKDFGAQGGSQQDGQAAASSATSSAGQGGSFEGNRDVSFGGHSGASSTRGDVQETQNQNQGSFSGHRNGFGGHGSFQQKHQENEAVKNFDSASTSGQTSSNGGNNGDIDYSHLQYGSSSKHQENQGSSFGVNQGGHGHDHFESDGSRQETKESNTFGAAGGQGNYGLESQDNGRRGGFSGHRGGPRHHGQGFDSELQNSNAGQAGFGSNQYQQSSRNEGQLQASGSGFGQGGQSSGLVSSGQQGFSRGSSNSDGQSALSGALNLASQGLQTSGQAGCSSCGKSSYALSNAKSRTGSAVAVSIGG